MVFFNAKNIDVKETVRGLVSFTPLIFLIMCFVSNSLFGLFEGVYYFSISHTVIKQPWLSAVFCISFPIIIEIGQFAFMLATIHNFMNRNPQRDSTKWFNVDINLLFSLIGLLATIFIVRFKLGELGNMVSFWHSGEFAPFIKSALSFLIVLGVVFEIRIVMILSDKK